MKTKISLMLLCAAALLAACSNKVKEVQALLKRTKQNMVYIKGGCFMMGYKSNDILSAGALEPHKVCLKPFYMSKYNVSYGDYDIYTKAIGKPKIQKENFNPRTGKPIFFRNAEHPVNFITWYQANDYCKWLRKKTGINYDLPTEAQWEYAARNLGKKGWDFATENGKLELGKNFPNGDMYGSQKGNRTHGDIAMPIGSLPCNPLGLCGMAGQVYQWVKDWYSPGYYSVSPINDPQGPKTGTKKAIRGSAAADSPGTSNYSRYPVLPNEKFAGFRLVINSDKPLDELGKNHNQR